MSALVRAASFDRVPDPPRYIASPHQVINRGALLHRPMRTTLDIDDDLLCAAKELARRDGITAGQMVSRLLRRSLTTPEPAGRRARPSPQRRRWASCRFRPAPA
jgi:hypothetical protein